MVYLISVILVVVGALNWGLVGITEFFFFFRFDLVEYIFINLLGFPALAYLVYVLVGVAGVIVAVKQFRK